MCPRSWGMSHPTVVRRWPSHPRSCPVAQLWLPLPPSLPPSPYPEQKFPLLPNHRPTEKDNDKPQVCFSSNSLILDACLEEIQNCIDCFKKYRIFVKHHLMPFYFPILVINVCYLLKANVWSRANSKFWSKTSRWTLIFRFVFSRVLEHDVAHLMWWWQPKQTEARRAAIINSDRKLPADSHSLASQYHDPGIIINSPRYYHKFSTPTLS